MKREKILGFRINKDLFILFFLYIGMKIRNKVRRSYPMDVVFDREKGHFYPKDVLEQRQMEYDMMRQIDRLLKLWRTYFFRKTDIYKILTWDGED